MTSLVPGLREARLIYGEHPSLGWIYAISKAFPDVNVRRRAYEFVCPTSGRELLDRAIEEAEKREAE